MMRIWRLWEFSTGFVEILVQIMVKNAADVDGQIRSIRLRKFLAVAFNLMREHYDIQAAAVQDYGYVIHCQPGAFFRIYFDKGRF
jgi:hypothetical protein